MFKIPAKYMGWPFAVILAVYMLLPTMSLAGNKRMIESRVEQLKQLNQQALQKIPNHPPNGRIHLKAEILPGPAPREIVIRKAEIQTDPKTFKSSLKAFVTEGPSMTALEPVQFEKGHRSFKEGILHYIQRLN